MPIALTSPAERVAACFSRRVASRVEALRRLLREALEGRLLGVEPWETLAWQRVKRILAEAMAGCICEEGCSVYLLEMHGGALSEDAGGKDIDLAVECSEAVDVAGLEAALEAAASRVLEWLVGGEPRRLIGIPNIVEVHRADEYIVKKHLERGGPHSRLLCQPRRAMNAR